MENRLEGKWEYLIGWWELFTFYNAAFYIFFKKSYFKLTKFCIIISLRLKIYLLANMPFQGIFLWNEEKKEYIGNRLKLKNFCEVQMYKL